MQELLEWQAVCITIRAIAARRKLSSKSSKSLFTFWTSPPSIWFAGIQHSETIARPKTSKWLALWFRLPPEGEDLSTVSCSSPLRPQLTRMHSRRDARGFQGSTIKHTPNTGHNTLYVHFRPVNHSREHLVNFFVTRYASSDNRLRFGRYVWRVLL